MSAMEKKRKNIDKSGFPIRTNLGQEFLNKLCEGEKQPDTESKLNLADVIIRCPVCKSENIADNSTYKSNGVIGHGHRSWRISDSRSCNNCGVIFKPVKGNGL